ncbi:MAG: hypothetical protein ACYDG2_25415 [Ruminiclostridium sp.]
MSLVSYCSNRYPYLALICAEAEEKAIKCYQDEVYDIEIGNGPPDEITVEEAQTKFIRHGKDEHEQQLTKREFEDYSKDSEPTVLLIDACLVWVQFKYYMLQITIF